jgi:hypothetical protein
VRWRVWLGPLAALVVLAALVALLRGGPQPKAPATAGGDTSPTLLSVDPNSVQAIDIEQGGAKLSLVRGSGQDANAWYIGHPGGQKADPQKVSDLLFQLQPLTATRSLGVVSSLQDYGLDKPTAALQLVLQGGQVKRLVVGAATPVGGDYATLGDGKVVILDAAFVDQLKAAPSAWLPAPTPTATSTTGGAATATATSTSGH